MCLATNIFQNKGACAIWANWTKLIKVGVVEQRKSLKFFLLFFLYLIKNKMIGTP
jgi:hypothetical protein